MTDSAFTAEQYDSVWQDGVEFHFWNLARNRLVLDAIHAASGGAPFRNVLEIGCGPGYVLRYLRAHGVNARGVEISPVRVHPDVAACVDAATDCFALPEAQRASTDCILLLDVIEHLPDPVAFLKRVRQAFPAARSLIVTVPARQELWSNYDTHYGHHRRYSRASLAADITGGGFKLRSSRYLFCALYPVMWGLQRLARQRSTDVAPPGNRALHRAASRYFLAEAAALPRGLWGTSIIGTATLD